MLIISGICEQDLDLLNLAPPQTTRHVEISSYFVWLLAFLLHLCIRLDAGIPVGKSYLRVRSRFIRHFTRQVSAFHVGSVNGRISEARLAWRLQPALRCTAQASSS